MTIQAKEARRVAISTSLRAEVSGSANGLAVTNLMVHYCSSASTNLASKISPPGHEFLVAHRRCTEQWHPPLRWLAGADRWEALAEAEIDECYRERNVRRDELVA